MQNRYVADIGDYVKLAILRALARNRTLGVVWWLLPNENHNADGGHREYLTRQDQWKHFDPELFEALLNIDDERRLDVRAIGESGVLPNALYVSDPVPCGGQPFSLRPEERRRWIEGIRTRIKDCNLVFLDPDNGIATERLRLTERRAGKSVTIEEIKELQQSGRAMVVYHHQTRRKGGHHSEIRDLTTRLRKSGLRVSGALRAKPWSPRAFFILNGDRELCDRAKSVAGVWRNHIVWYPEVEILENSK
jgi:hypothetical protein